MNKWAPATVVLIALLGGCSRPSSRLPGVEVKPPLDLRPYCEEAQHNLPEFLEALEHRARFPGRERYEAKATGIDWDGQPHVLWFDASQFEDGELKLIAGASRPDRMNSYQKLPPTSVLDWLYWDEGELHGGFSLLDSLENLVSTERVVTEKRLRGDPELWKAFSESAHCILGEAHGTERLNRATVELSTFEFSIPREYSESNSIPPRSFRRSERSGPLGSATPGAPA